MLSRKYNSHILCLSSLVYLLAGIIVIDKNLYLSILLFGVTTFSILYHHSFKNISLKILDWTFAMILFLYALYIVRVKFDPYILIIIAAIVVFKVVDHIVFKTRHYRIFNYTHSVWHFFSALIIVLAITFI